MIDIQDVSFTYGNQVMILKNLTINIQKGEFVAIVGQNGAGKTTLLKHLNGLLKPTSGHVIIDGMDTSHYKTSQLARHISFLFQNPDHQIFCRNVFEEIAFGLKNLGFSQKDIQDKVIKASRAVRIEKTLNLDPAILGRGMRQRVALASVLAMETEILVLDEPTTGQDYREGTQIMEMVKTLNENGQTIIAVTHDMELVSKYAQRVIILMDGCVIKDGPVHDVLSDTEALAASHLKPPQVLELAGRFSGTGLFQGVQSVEDMVERIKGMKGIG